MVYEVLKKFARASTITEKAALNLYELLPLSFRYSVLYGPDFLRWLSLLKEAESWDKDRVSSYQLEQTKALLTHAMKHVPYYRKLFRRLGFRPEHIQSIDDLKNLPYLSKDDIRGNPTEFLDERIPLKSLARIPTGGSSGIPLTIYRRRENEAAFLAFRASILGRTGYSPKRREVVVWVDPKLGGKTVTSFRYGKKLILSNGFMAGKWLMRYLDMIREFSPEYILGYPSALAVLAAFAEHNNLRPPDNIKAVISYAENLYDWQRALLEKYFCSHVLSMYAMTERCAIGGGCEFSNSLHFHPLYGVIEFGDWQSGYKEIIATGFTNYEMPLIRFRTGDLVQEYSGHCDACGRQHTTIGMIEGRTHSYLVGKNNELIPGITSWLGTFPNVLGYQFFQQQKGIAYLNIVPSEGFSESDRSFILAELERIFRLTKDAIEIKLAFTDHLVRTPSGKINMVEQKLDIYRSL